MSPLNLDHVGIAVHDLDAAAEQYRRLGFQLTPRGYHTLPAKPDGERPRVGSGNNCAMLERGYIELIGIVDPNYVGRLRDDLARYEGLHIVAFGTMDTQAAIKSLHSSGIPGAAARLLERPIEHAGKTEIARFEIIDFGDVLPELYSFAIRHATPGALWKPELLTHPNGAKSLESITVAVADVGEFADRLGRTVGSGAKGTTTKTVELERGKVRVVGPEWSSSEAKKTPPLPAVVEMTLGTSRLALAADVLSKASISFGRNGQSLKVAAADACGVTIEFVEV
jgi:catechol 2,3-dioxygenase-like lactoylglutathione lyase family enzyme